MQIVDFCCGANDFSVIMKKKLEETGKNCYYKNYDLFQAKVMLIIIDFYNAESHISYYYCICKHHCFIDHLPALLSF